MSGFDVSAAFHDRVRLLLDKFDDDYNASSFTDDKARLVSVLSEEYVRALPTMRRIGDIAESGFTGNHIQARILFDFSKFNTPGTGLRISIDPVDNDTQGDRS